MSHYKRWNYQGKLEFLEELKEWVAEEAEYHIQASEVKNGVSSASGKHVKWPLLYFGTGDKRDCPCKVCNQKHNLEVQGAQRNGNKKWETAKKLGLCYCCFEECRVDGCKENHHQILHQKKSLPDSKGRGSVEGNPDPSDSSNVCGNESSTYEIVKEHEQRRIALPTVPVILKHGAQHLQVNYFLGEGRVPSLDGWVDTVMLQNHRIVFVVAWNRLTG